MELQLGLSLPSNNNNVGFDLNNLNNNGFDPCMDHCNIGDSCFRKKRRFEDVDYDDVCSGENIIQETLPLLLWSGQPNGEDDRQGEKKRISCRVINKRLEEEEGDIHDQVVGWPPIKSWRKKLLQGQQNINQEGGQELANNHNHHRRYIVGREENGGSSNSRFVKVKMAGVAITRKINLKSYSSYQTLTSSLITMFDKCSMCIGKKLEIEGPSNYTLAYQDKDGDWLLVGDLPWQTFIQSVQRLEILRKNGG